MFGTLRVTFKKLGDFLNQNLWVTLKIIIDCGFFHPSIGLLRKGWEERE